MFGIEIMDAALLPALMVALIAGVISFASPCVLPVVPAYLSYMTGTSLEDMEKSRGRAVLTAVFFVMGLSTVFLFLGLAAAAAGQAFLRWQQYFPIAAGIMVMIFGLHFLGIIRIGFLMREARLDAGDQGGSPFGAYLLGLAFAFGWTPCIGPILGTILSLVAQEADMSRGLALMAAYAIGLGLPFVLVALFFGTARGVMARLKRHMDRIERIAGLLLWTIGLMLISGQFSRLSFWLLDMFPALGAIG